MTATELHLRPRYLDQVKAILHRQMPGVEVWAYGSRVDGTCYDGSDLDLALRAPGLARIPHDRLRGLRYAFRDSTIPILVEVRDWAAMPEFFHREIETNYVVLLPGIDSGRPRTSSAATDPDR